MKLLFDENLSHKLVRLLADLFPDLLEGFRPAPAKFLVGISAESRVGPLG